MVQDKLHFAAEVIYERADAKKPFMGLTTFSSELPALKDNIEYALENKTPLWLFRFLY